MAWRYAGLSALLGLFSIACASETDGFVDDDGTDDAELRGECRIPKAERKLDFDARRALLTTIKRVASDEGMPNAALVVAGIGAHETGLVQCWKDAKQYCQGPYSSTCNGPVLAGSGDGACSHKQGGLGIFQFDAGTHNQTLASYGKDILTETGNVRGAFRLIVSKLQSCGMSALPVDTETKAWLDGLRVGSPDYERYLNVMARCYNGAGERTCQFKRVRASYDAAIRFLLEDGGTEFWYGARATDRPNGL